ncbi:pre-mRNA-splicing factor SYF2 [Tanacetum coccineum]
MLLIRLSLEVTDDHPNDNDDNMVDDEPGVDVSNLTGKQKKLFALRLKMVNIIYIYPILFPLVMTYACNSAHSVFLHMQNEARKSDQTAMVAEKKIMKAPKESREISKQKWMEEMKKQIGKLLNPNGLDMSNSYMLDTQHMAKAKYKRWRSIPL